MSWSDGLLDYWSFGFGHCQYEIHSLNDRQGVEINQLQAIDAIEVANIDGQQRQIVHEAGGGNKCVFDADLQILSNQAHVQFRCPSSNFFR